LFYCLDTLPIVLVFLTYILLHPGRLLPPHGTVLPTTDGETAAAAFGDDGGIKLRQHTTEEDLEAVGPPQEQFKVAAL
jgi:hypothetical protein